MINNEFRLRVVHRYEDKGYIETIVGIGAEDEPLTEYWMYRTGDNVKHRLAYWEGIPESNKDEIYEDMSEFFMYALERKVKNDFSYGKTFKLCTDFVVDDFRSYSSFEYVVKGEFKIGVVEDAHGKTEVFVDGVNGKRKVIVIDQFAFYVFRNVSPTHFMYLVSEFIVKMYLEDRISGYQNMDELLMSIE